MSLARWLHDTLVGLMRLERRIDPFVRPAFDAILREPLTGIVQWCLRRRLPATDLARAAEQELPDEARLVDRIVEDMTAHSMAQYRPGAFERAGNTKTHGVVRAEFTVHDGLPSNLRHGVLAQPRSFRAWVRFGGPGPASPPDIDDVGVLSIGVKLMGVPGRKLLDDEQHTQDLTGISTPTFTTSTLAVNANLQAMIRAGTPLFHFLSVRRPHVLEGLMQALWARTQTNPLTTRYWSCVPYLLGPDQAMQYSFRPRTARRDRVPNLPLRPPDDYLRQAMARTLATGDAEFDVLVQLQTDARRMPIENAGIRWSERRSPPIPVAVLRIPSQHFDSPAQLAFAHSLSIQPWHCLPEHRPLGNQNRGRRRIYLELSRLRQQQNRTPHVEPTGDEVFGAPSTPPAAAVNRPPSASPPAAAS